MKSLKKRLKRIRHTKIYRSTSPVLKGVVSSIALFLVYMWPPVNTIGQTQMPIETYRSQNLDLEENVRSELVIEVKFDKKFRYLKYKSYWQTSPYDFLYMKTILENGPCKSLKSRSIFSLTNDELKCVHNDYYIFQSRQLEQLKRLKRSSTAEFDLNWDNDPQPLMFQPKRFIRFTPEFDMDLNVWDSSI